MTSNDCRRKQYLIDKQVQLQIAVRVAVYGFASILFVLLTLTFWQTFVGKGGSFTGNLFELVVNYAPFFGMMTLFIPFAIYDSIRLTHKVAGPLFRLRTDLAKYETDNQKRIKFRDDDLLQDLPVSINKLMDRIAALEQQVQDQTEDVLV